MRKELKQLSRSDLLEIIYEMKKNEEDLEKKLSEARKELEKREMVMENAGTLADAIVNISGILGVAQKVADTYIHSVRESYGNKEKEIEESRERILDEARVEAMGIIEAARRERERILSGTNYTEDINKEDIIDNNITEPNDKEADDTE